MGFERGGVEGDMIQNQTSPDFRFPEVSISAMYIHQFVWNMTDCYL